MLLTKTPNAPIPGENFTSDRKNYPWHRPPDHNDLDAAIVAAMKQLSTRQSTYGLLNALQLGVTVVQAATMFAISGVGAGKWTTDHALLLAGPIAKIIQIMADGAKIKYSMGLEDDPLPTISYYGDVKNVDQQSVTFAQEAAKSKISSVRPPNPDANAAPVSPTGAPMPANSAPAPSGGGFAAKPPDNQFVNANLGMKQLLPHVPTPNLGLSPANLNTGGF